MPTTNYNFLQPIPSNKMSDDVAAIATAIQSIDTQIKTLESLVGSKAASSALAGYLSTTLAGQANGIAQLDAQGQVPLAQIPTTLIAAGWQFQGYWDPALNLPAIPGANQSRKNYFYICSTHGNSDVFGLKPWNTDDIVYCTGSAWIRIKGASPTTFLGQRSVANIPGIVINGLNVFKEEITVRFNSLKCAAANEVIVLNMLSLGGQGSFLVSKKDMVLAGAQDGGISGLATTINLTSNGANTLRIDNTASGSGLSGVITIRPRAETIANYAQTCDVYGRLSYKNNAGNEHFGSFSAVWSVSATGGTFDSVYINSTGNIASGTYSVEGR